MESVKQLDPSSHAFVDLCRHMFGAYKKEEYFHLRCYRAASLCSVIMGGERCIERERGVVFLYRGEGRGGEGGGGDGSVRSADYDGGAWIMEHIPLSLSLSSWEIRREKLRERERELRSCHIAIRASQEEEWDSEKVRREQEREEISQSCFKFSLTTCSPPSC